MMALGQPVERDVRRPIRVNFGGRPPAYFGASESNPSALKLWITSRTRSSDVNAIFAIAGTSMRWADHNTICARRQRTTDPDPRRTIPSNLLPSTGVRSRTCTRSAIDQVCATHIATWWTRHPIRCRLRH